MKISVKYIHTSNKTFWIDFEGTRCGPKSVLNVAEANHIQGGRLEIAEVKVISNVLTNNDIPFDYMNTTMITKFVNRCNKAKMSDADVQMALETDGLRQELLGF